MKGGVTKRIEDITKALDTKQLKKALYLSDTRGLERHHEWIEEAARTCLANRDNKSACEKAIKEARNKVQNTVSLPIDDTNLEGLEDYMTEQQLPEEPQTVEVPAPLEVPAPVVDPTSLSPQTEKTDEELYEDCEPCHVAVAATRFADICSERRDEGGVGCELIGRSLENPDTEPVDWLKAMIETAEKAEGAAKAEMTAAISELSEYLERRDSPFLKALDKEGGNGQETTTLSSHPED